MNKHLLSCCGTTQHFVSFYYFTMLRRHSHSWLHADTI